MKSKEVKNPRTEKLFEKIAALPDEAGRQRFLRRHQRLLRADVAEKLARAVYDHLRVDVPQSLRLAEAAVAVAREIDNKETLAISLRAKANALYFMGQNRSAVDLHEQCLVLFRELGRDNEVARTLNSSIQPLALLGEYQQAYTAAELARKIFTEKRENRRLARLENNLGNILHRQDRFADALACYERAYQQLLPYQDIEGIAVTLHNMAVCLISLNDFHRALEAYQNARALSEQHGLVLLTVQADYNIAYLYYLRGEYSRAIELLSATRESCGRYGDAYHLALCNLDQSEIFLELNLVEEAAEMAQEGFTQFQRLGMGYEAAKSLVNLAIARSEQKDISRALDLFRQARGMFVREKNRVWPSLIDLYQALVLFNAGRFFEARQLTVAALDFFGSSILPGKAVLCKLLLARLSVYANDLASGRRHCSEALMQLAKIESPILSYQAHILMGRIQDTAGDVAKACDCYQKARRTLEKLHTGLRAEELKIAFMKNKQEVYEGLVRLHLRGDSNLVTTENAFGYIEQAKSRSLRDLIFGRAHPLPAGKSGRDQSELVRRIRDLREELNWCYRRVELEQLRWEELSPKRIEQLQDRARAREGELQHLLRDLPPSEPEHVALHPPAVSSVEEIRAALTPDTTIVEYFRVDDRVVAALLTRKRLEILPVTSLSRVTGMLRMLRFQLAKFCLGEDYIATFRESFLSATNAHLRELYNELIAPVRRRLQGTHLVMVPHGVLHYLPFQALFDGKRYLIDSFTLSYAPSADIYANCHRKSANATGPSLILGVPDLHAPSILQEVESVAAMLPGSEVFLGSEANEAVLSRKGPTSRVVHIATHGSFRQDNPMFSAIRLGGSYLNLYDLYKLKLPVELVTLSGCATGLNVVAGGDELLGLARGLLYAGAQTLLLTMWDVHDASTAEFMKSFYGRLRQHGQKALALREAMLDLRQRYAHPYYWAPFALVGKAFASSN
ncbi:MAG TPA: CHAT domain-containing tetratricopeptide repeat protein [Acidobacteriota bacterium]